MGCAGNTIVRTPELDRLAGAGVRFENHFTTSPVCGPSRASIMTSQYPSTNGILGNKTSFTEAQVREAYWMKLKDAGYHIGFIGKFGVGDNLPVSRFDFWRGFAGNGQYYPDGPSGRHLTEIQRDQATEFLRSVPAHQPFCLSLSFKAPHVQDQDPRQYLPTPDTLSLYENETIPPPRGAGPEDVRRFPAAIQHSETRKRWGVRFSTPELYQASVKGYYRLISGIDSVIGSIRKTLREQQLDGNTIIIYSADHGIFNGEHGFAGKWYGHDEALHIPLIVYDPRHAAAGRAGTRRGMSLNIDLAPTVLDLAGVQAPERMQGRSLVPLLREDQPGWRRLSFFEHHYPIGGWIPSSEGIRTGQWKYIRWTDSAAPFEELYHLADDPFETKNLAGNPEFARQHGALTKYWQEWRDSLRRDPGTWREPISEADLKRDGLI